MAVSLVIAYNNIVYKKVDMYGEEKSNIKPIKVRKVKPRVKKKSKNISSVNIQPDITVRRGGRTGK